MKPSITVCITILLMCFAKASVAAATGLLPGESITRDPVTGDYTALYWGMDDDGNTGSRLERATLETATKIEPNVRSGIKLHQDWSVGYQYRISNGKGAKQSINDFDLYGLPLDTRILNTDKVSNSDNSFSIEFYTFGMQTPANTCWHSGGASNGQTTNLGWFCSGWDRSINGYNTTWGIAPGATLSGFGFASSDLPGVFMAKLVGNTKWHGFDYSWHRSQKSSMDDQMGEIVNNDNIPRNIAAPLIPVPTPFDPAIVLDNLRTHVATWPSKQLADTTFAAQLDAEMVVVANAYRANQPEVARDHIEILLDMIRRDHKDLDHDGDEEHDEKHGTKERARQTKPMLIDRLAARVLDFDLKYVLKRMKKDDDEHKKH